MSDFTVTATPMPAAADEPAPPPAQRIATLDIVRGVAVMGILAMNIVAFAMPFQAYVNPTAYGLEGPADLGSWVFSFILIDGKMRGLFSFLFGASTLLVIERAEQAGASPAKVHYARMFWLLVFGLIHFYLIWFGDILALYALCGLLLYFFSDLSVKALVRWGIGLITVQTVLMAAAGVSAMFFAYKAGLPNPNPEMVTQWNEMREGFAVPTGQELSEKLAMFQGAWSGIVEHKLERWMAPFVGFFFSGAETIGYMLFGMAALKSGFLRGEWAPARYRKWAIVCFAIAIPAYAVMAWLLINQEFAPQWLFAIWLGAATPVRPLAIVATAALIILLTRSGGPLIERIAAAGRAAFTNYLGTSILMTTLFYGYGIGLYGELSRIELWIPVVAMWAVMLLWSKPWLDRFTYGPLEWLWRSLARFRLQPMRKAP
jgi:uncharacterized protein